MRRVLICLAAGALLAGCGNDRTPPPDTGFVRSPGPFHAVEYPKAGLSLRVPERWPRAPDTGRQVVRISSGDALIAIWRYPRSEPLPLTRAQLHATRTSLIAQVQARDPTFRLTSSRLIRRSGLRAVELLGTGTIQGVQRSIRSLHAYGHKAEVVMDAFAPAKDFPRVDQQTFRPVLGSLKLTAPRA